MVIIMRLIILVVKHTLRDYNFVICGGLMVVGGQLWVGWVALVVLLPCFHLFIDQLVIYITLYSRN